MGKRRLERAIRQLDPTRVTAVIRMHPFFLDSTLPTASIDKMAHYHNKFGAERFKAMIPRMKAVGLDAGIEFSYGGKIGSTLMSHRLLRYVANRAGPEGEAEEARAARVSGMVDVLFKGYFEEEQDIADIDTLTRLAMKLPEMEGREKDIREWLAGKEEEANVQNEVSATTAAQRYQHAIHTQSICLQPTLCRSLIISRCRSAVVVR